MRRSHRNCPFPDGHPHGLPLDHPSRREGRSAGFPGFVGRVDELAQLARLLDGSRLVTVAGVGGVGKSRLAMQAAAAVQNRFTDGVGLVELAAVHDPGLIGHALAEALDITHRTSRSPRDVLVDHLAERELLLVLDGVEHLAAECADLVADLLAAAPGLRILATGRRPLRLPNEATLPLAPLSESDAVQLFADRAALTLARFRLTDGDQHRVQEICRRLDGIPLALELAAGRLAGLTLDQVLERLDDRFRLLTGGGRALPPRHQTLRTTIGWSHELCTPPERLLWARLTVFAGEFDSEAVEYVCSGPDLPAESVPGVLAELVAQSVVSRTRTPAGVRYRMLDTLRVYGGEWLAALGDDMRLRKRHRDWYMGLATWCELDWFSPRQLEVAACAESALPNLRAALELCLERDGDTHLGQHLAGTLWFFWVGCGRLAEGRHWLDRALALPNAHAPSRLKAQWVLGQVALLQGDGAAAERVLHDCREVAIRTDHPVAVAYAVHRLGSLALLSDSTPRAEDLLRGALASYRELGELNSNVLLAQTSLAMALAFQDRGEEAVRLCEEVLESCQGNGELWARSYALYALGYTAQMAGDRATARTRLSAAVSIAHRFNDPVGAALCLELLALVTAETGGTAEAALLLGAAAAVWDELGVHLAGLGRFGAPRELCRRLTVGALGSERYGSLVREGRALLLDAAVQRVVAPPDRCPPVPQGRTAEQSAAPTAPGMRKPAGSPIPQGGETAG
ncbi:ATP-binding protein [Streptomyces albipurpureus]|uniref:Regulator n=1 Tax=Streptomyces albipurpureus TaxID=2897419 RepID=A0ABT0UWK0_9ACTN|nr:regulator [Streptomyces sp. CWNU-1]MCM2392821.1 regulator [Streptomyces sp. CWNU-1]